MSTTDGGAVTLAELERIYVAAEKSKRAEIAHDAHYICCDRCSDGHQCERGGELFTAATLARSDFWAALTAVAAAEPDETGAGAAGEGVAK